MLNIQGNIDDRDEDVLDEVLKNVSGKLYADKGYISKKLFENLFEKGITLVTSNLSSTEYHIHNFTRFFIGNDRFLQD